MENPMFCPLRTRLLPVHLPIYVDSMKGLPNMGWTRTKTSIWAHAQPAPPTTILPNDPHITTFVWKENTY